MNHIQILPTEWTLEQKLHANTKNMRTPSVRGFKKT